MKKIMILVLSLAVLFGFAACDNSTPATDTPEGTPVTVDATRLAAQQVNYLLFEEIQGSSPATSLIDISTIISDAGNSVSASGETVVITKNYPNGGSIVGNVTLTLGGTYTAAKGSDSATLAVTEYTIAATDLQVPGYGSGNYSSYYGDAEKVTFSISGAVDGNLVYTFNSNGSITSSGSVTTVYTTLPVQSASITMNIPVSRTTTGYVYESREISGAAFIEAFATVAGDDHSAYKFMQDEFAEYWTQINTYDTGILAVITDYLDGGEDTVADADATVTYASTNSQDSTGAYKQTGTVTVAFTANDYKLNASSSAVLDGDFTIVFSTERTGATMEALNQAAIVATGYTLTADGIELTGTGYPLTVSADMVGTGLTTTPSSESVTFTWNATDSKISAAEINDLGDIAGSVTANGVSFNK